MKMWVDPPEIYLYRDAVDFRKSINGLVMVVEQELALSPFAEARLVPIHQLELIPPPVAKHIQGFGKRG